MAAFSFYIQTPNLTHVTAIADRRGINFGIADIRHAPTSVRLTSSEAIGLIGALEQMRASIERDRLDVFAFDMRPESGSLCALRHAGVPDRTIIVVRTPERGIARACFDADSTIDDVIEMLLSAIKMHLTLRYSPAMRDLN